MESGYIDDINRKYTNTRKCSANMNNRDMQYGLERTGGLFIMLICAIVLSILLLGLEHIVFKLFVPFVRTKQSNSKWKTRNLEYISQVSGQSYLNNSSFIVYLYEKTAYNSIVLTTWSNHSKHYFLFINIGTVPYLS